MKDDKVQGESAQFYTWAAIGLGITYFTGMWLDVMDVDAAQYALISKEMAASGSWLEVTERGKDYLDKPPLLFWFTALAYKLLGVSNFVYRIFPILSTVLGVYATFRLGSLYYGATVGRVAGLFLGSCQAYFLINHDVRTDTMLTNAIIFAIWQMAVYLRTGSWLYFVGAFTGVAAAMLAKGPIGLMVPVLAFATDFVLKRQWLNFLRWQWLLGVVIVLLYLSPMLYGLYRQFDAQPEKVVLGNTHTSGLYFYFWKQSFGRLTGENVWKDDSDAFFFVHSFVWSFLPWALLFFPALWRDMWALVQQRFRLQDHQEAITLGGFILPFIALSFSHFKLPHYIYPMFPLGAIITAKWVVHLATDAPLRYFRWNSYTLYFTVSALWLIQYLLTIFCFPPRDMGEYIWLAAVNGGLIAAVYYLITTRTRFERLLYAPLVSIIAINFFLNGYVYPRLFAYQSGSVMARKIKALNIAPSRVYVFLQNNDDGIYVHSLDFYSTHTIAGEVKQLTDFEALLKQGALWIYTDAKGLAALQAQYKTQAKVLFTTPRFHISQLNGTFLNEQTRTQELKPMHLVQLQ